MIYYFSSIIAAWLIKRDKDNKFIYEDLEHALKIVTNLGSILFITTMFSIVTGQYIHTMLALISICLMRYYTGGFHFRSSDFCVVYSSTIILSVPYINNITIDHICLINCLTIIFIILFAPFDIGFKFTDLQVLKLKLITLLIILLNIYIIKNTYIESSFFIQSVDLLLFIIPRGEED